MNELSSELSWLFRRSVSRFYALKTLLECGGKGDIEELGELAYKKCPISYSLGAMQNSTWRTLKRRGLVNIGPKKTVQVKKNIISNLTKEIQHIESTIKELNNKGILLNKDELGTTKKDSNRRKQLMEFLISADQGMRREELVKTFRFPPKQIHDDIKVINSILAAKTGYDFVVVQISNKGIWIEYYLPLKNIQVV